MYFFCLDIGGTKTHGALYGENGQFLAQSTSTGGALTLGLKTAEHAIRNTWQNICVDLHQSVPSPAQTILCAGIAGASLPNKPQELATALSDFAQTQFVSDGYGALLGATKGKPGTLISIGTGVTAMSLDATGQTTAISGWGFPAGDLGGGAWLGLQLISMLTKHIDKIVLPHPITPNLFGQLIEITGATAGEIKAWQTNATPAQFASLGRIVAHAASEDDLLCRALLNAAAVEIIALACTLQRDNPQTVFLAGGLAATLQPFCKAQAPQFDWRTSETDAVSGVYLLASGQAPKENHKA